MMRKLIKALFTTFVLSVVVSIAAICLLYAISKKGADYGRAVPLIIMGSLYLNFILLLLSSPALFTSFPDIYKKKLMRFFLYFSGPLVFILTSFGLPSASDKKAYLLTGVIFIIIQAVSYYKMVKSII